MNPLAYLAYFSMLMLDFYILVYGARWLLMLAGDSLILLSHHHATVKPSSRYS
jgi:hypothetical protein